MDTGKTNQTALKFEISPSLWEKLQLHGQLYDFYGTLLTERQNACFTMHYLEDFSLAEVGEALGITPQAVADQIKRTIKIMQGYEKKLGLIKNWHEQQSRVKQINNALDELIESGYPLKKIKDMIAEI